jgi:transcriptional regulator with GAF, ATPase, and Fis domain
MRASCAKWAEAIGSQRDAQICESGKLERNLVIYELSSHFSTKLRRECPVNCGNFPQLMVSMARHRSLSEVLNAMAVGIAQCGNIVLARIWLNELGDICETCKFREECPDQTRCLHLVASAGNPRDGKSDYTRLDGSFRRMPLGVRKVGHVGKTGEPILMPDLKGDEKWIADPEWVKREGVRTIAAQPLVFRGETLGVMAIFDCEVLGDEDFDWLRVFADYAAVSIANARAIEEIEYLQARLEEENNYLREEVTEALGASDIVGSSAGLAKVLQQIQLVAPTDATALVTGESGTGKELVARAIHDNSPRKGRALIKVNCGAVPESLFESEFFGHVKGAFTGAIKDKPGRFELADGGTIFLDEIGEIPLPLQSKLLRVLQEGELERIGEARTRKVDVRLVAATNRNLLEEVEAGRFRQDLFYRLSVFPIEIPPLRERREDIEPLVMHFVKQSARRMNRPSPRVTQATMQRFLAHDWPGNVRELQNSIERAVILSQGGPIRFEGPATGAGEPTAVVGASERSGALLTRGELKQRERESIVTALRESGGKIFGVGGAAELLEMKPTTLASRIKKLGIDKSAL